MQLFSASLRSTTGSPDGQGLLLETRDGTLYLAIWLEQPSCQTLRHGRHGSSRSQTPHAKAFGSLSGAAHHQIYALPNVRKTLDTIPSRAKAYDISRASLLPFSLRTSM